MVPAALPADHPAPLVGLPPRLHGPHAACRGAGCAGCLRTGLACGAWVVFERDQERRSAEQFHDALAWELAALLDDCAGDLARLIAEHPGDPDPVIARVARATERHHWVLHGAKRAGAASGVPR